MNISIHVGSHSHRDIRNVTEFVQFAESLGVEMAWSAEGWSQDAVTSLAYLAGQTHQIKLGTGIMQTSARAPAMTAMTALSMASLSDGRFLLGLGTSGPQVVEGMHNLSFDAPLTRLKENVEICRRAFRGEKLEFAGRHYQMPLPDGEGKALRLDFEPTDIPIYLATLGERSLAYTGEVADGWLGTSFSPDFPEAHLAHIRRGAERAGRTLADIDLQTACNVAIGDDVEGLIAAAKPKFAFTLGAMGSAATNFYNAAFQRAGFVDDAEAVQSLWIDGKRDAAAARVPDELVTAFAAIGTPAMVRDRFKAYAHAGINCLDVRFDLLDITEHFAQLEQTVDLANSI
ncbi:MAG: LLM class flavin-dependent oxidoreductase [Pseudomonadota bacterium]